MLGMCVVRPARGALSASETGRDRSSRVHQGQNKVQHKQSVQSVSLFFLIRVRRNETPRFVEI